MAAKHEARKLDASFGACATPHAASVTTRRRAVAPTRQPVTSARLARGRLHTMPRVSANQHPLAPRLDASASDPFVTAAVATLTASLYGAQARAATAWLAVLGLLTFGPLAMASRNGMAIGALMAFGLACIVRWAAGWAFEQERAQAQPMLVLILHALMGIAWAVAGVATMLTPWGHGTALTLVASSIVCAASVPMFNGHRDACWWLLAPMVLLPAALPFAPLPATPGEWAWPLAAACAGGLALAGWQAHKAQALTLEHLALQLRAKCLHTELNKHQQAAAQATRRADTLERDINLLHNHANVGMAKVNGYVIDGVNAHLARSLGMQADQFARRDVLSLFAKHHHPALEALMKRAARADGPQTGVERERVDLATSVPRSVDVLVPRGGDAARLWLVTDAITAAADDPEALTPAPAATTSPRAVVLDRLGLQQRLSAHAQRHERVTVVTVALLGLDAVAEAEGDPAADRMRATAAQRLHAVCRTDGDAVAALDDACFALLLTSDLSDFSLDLLRERVHSAMATPHAMGERSLALSVNTRGLRLELDVLKATTAMAQLDEIVRAGVRARAQLAAGDDATASVVRPRIAEPPLPELAVPQIPDSAGLAPDEPDYTLRDDAMMVGRRRHARAVAVAESVRIDMITLDPQPDTALAGAADGEVFEPLLLKT